MLGMSAPQPYNHQDILLFASDGSLFSACNRDVWRGNESNSYTAAFLVWNRLNFFSSYTSPFPVHRLSDNQLLISFTSVSLHLPRLYFLTFAAFGSNHFSGCTGDNRN